MFKNYLKVTIRNLLKHKTYSLINILGLSVGLACTILILLWVQDELSVDRYHKKGDRIAEAYLKGLRMKILPSSQLFPLLFQKCYWMNTRK